MTEAVPANDEVAKPEPLPPTTTITFNAQEKEIVLHSLDHLIRKIGEEVSKLGVNSAQDAAIKMVQVRNLAIKIDANKLSSLKPEAKEAKAEAPRAKRQK